MNVKEFVADLATSVKEHQDSEVNADIAKMLKELRDTILYAAAHGENRIILNNILYGMTRAERRVVFKAADIICSDKTFEQNSHWVGGAYSYQNASNDPYVYTLFW